MANCTTKDKMEFAYLMAKHSSATLYDIQRLMRYGAKFHAIQERQCNGYANTDWGRAQESRDKRKEESVVRRIGDILANLEPKGVTGCSVFAKFGGDPRGCTVKIVVPDGYTNDWGREGICVPTA